MFNCPGCTLPLSNGAVACNACGWSRTGNAKTGDDPDWWRCCDFDRGRGCTHPGSLSESTKGGSPWYCARHFPPFGRWNAGPTTAPPANLFARFKSKPIDFEAEAERLAIQADNA